MKFVLLDGTYVAAAQITHFKADPDNTDRTFVYIVGKSDPLVVEMRVYDALSLIRIYS